MRRKSAVVLVLVVALALVLAACGGSNEPVVKKPAREITIGVDDLGAGWRMVKEWDGLDAMNLKASSYLDGNMRRFEGKGRLAIVLVATTKRMKRAQTEFKREDAFDTTISNVRRIFPDMTIGGVEAPAIADEQRMIQGEFGPARMYSIFFREDNVLVSLTLVGDEKVASQEAITRLAKTMVSRTQ